ncbi:MAG TPA: glycosyltransferase family 4 protein [Longimicrobium sp.]|nr:glycosyltransferase family 4 protein [Longimicrobium sp.]
MRVVLASGVYPPSVGGPSAQTRLLARELMARNVAARVLTWGDAAGDAVVDGVPVRFVRTHGARSMAAKAAVYRRLFGEIRGFLREFAPDVVHTMTSGGPLSLLTGLAARSLGIPVLSKYTADASEERVHLARQGGADSAGPGLRGRVHGAAVHAAQRLLFRLSARVWTTTPLFARRVGEKFRIRPGRIFLLPNFIDLRPFAAAAQAVPDRAGDATLRLLTVARLSPIKGVETCIGALAHLRDLPVVLRIVGTAAVEAEYVRFLHQRVRELGVEARVDWAGAVPNEHIAAEYAAADVLLQGSFYEAFGMALAEAMAAGVPVVATAVGGVPDVVEDGASGILVPAGDPAAMADAVRRLLTDPMLRGRLMAGGRLRAERFGAAGCIDRMVEEYGRMAAERGRAPSLKADGSALHAPALGEALLITPNGRDGGGDS